MSTPGAIVTLTDAYERPLGTAMFNPRPLISARVLDRNAAAEINSDWLAARFVALGCSFHALEQHGHGLSLQRDTGGGAMRALLHFEAADWNVTVWLNGALLGSHVGAYDPFSFDITDGANARRNAVQYITNERRNDPSSPQRSRRTGRRTSCSSACSTRPPTTRRTASRT